MGKNKLEVQIGKSRVYLSEEGIMNIDVIGRIDERISNRLKELGQEFSDMIGKKLHIIVDLNKTGIPSTGARRVFQEELKGERYGKVALFGLHPVARVIGSFVMGVSRKKDMHFFKTREEALAWLKE